MLLNPTQNRDKNYQGEDINCPNRAYRDKLGFHRFHIKDPEGNDEKGEVTDKEYQPGGTTVPPGVIPGEGIGEVEQNLYEDAED